VNPYRVAPAIHQDYQTGILDIININICMWLKAMAPMVTKHYHRFRNLIYEVAVLSKGEESPLLLQNLTLPLCNDLAFEGAS
jgi:hypothetical protein